MPVIGGQAMAATTCERKKEQGLHLAPPARRTTYSSEHQCRVTHMSAKKYEVRRVRIPDQQGGYFEAFRLALVDLACFGERNLDLTGYPHESEEAALASDWQALGVDFRCAYKKLAEEAERGSEDVNSKRSSTTTEPTT